MATPSGKAVSGDFFIPPPGYNVSDVEYMGRMAIAEILDMSDRIRELILDRKSAAEIKRAAREEGMTFMRESAVKRVLEGKTTLREINKVTFVE